MAESVGMSGAEARIYRAYWQDGSVDLFAGLIAGAIGISWLLDLVWLGPTAPVLLVPFWAVLRRRVVEPRLGRVRFRPERMRRIRRGHLAALAVGVVALSVALGLFLTTGDAAPGEWSRRLVPALPGALVGLGCGVSAVAFGLPRMMAYAVLFLLAGLGAAVFDLDPGWSLFGGGVVTALAGVALLARFVRAFPVLDPELE
ncbi:MAG: hypothetical protein AB7R55_12835 [Gemmatimonadales bacterium]